MSLESENDPIRELGVTPLLLFVVNVDWFFLSHRLPLAFAAKKAGYRVAVAAADTGQGARIESEGLEFFPLPFSRSGTGFLEELRTLVALTRLYRELRPSVVHHVTIKPVLYGSLVARVMNSIPTVNAISGLGYTFTDAERSRGLRRIATMLYRIALAHPRSKVIFQNPDDVDLFRRLGLIRADQIVLIRGSGVDCDVFCPRPEAQGDPVVMLPARMLWDKGVREFVEAARLVRDKGQRARFVLVGGIDEENPSAVPGEQILAWQNEGTVEWWGHQNDMHEVLPKGHIVVLPSYREGLPKVLLEAAACGRPIITTDVPGCREVVRHGENGLLVRAREVEGLATAIEKLIQDSQLRRAYGERGREMAVEQFSIDMVVRQTLEVYRSLLRAADLR